MTDSPSLFSRQRVLEDLRALGFRFQEKRGQNFLFDSNLLEALVRDSGIEAGDRVLEVGPGAGTLTRVLLDLECQVTSVEIDPLLCQFLRERFDQPQFRLIEGDVLETKNRLSRKVLADLDPSEGQQRGFHLVANLPYSIAGPLVAMLVAEREDLKSIGVLVQREMAQRWVASAGTREFGTTSVLLALTGIGKISRSVPAAAFVPAPRVESSFFTWTRDCDRAPIPVGLVKLVRHCFQFRRKTLGKILRQQLSPEDSWWHQEGVETSIRPDQMTPNQWASLALRFDSESV
ncbi:MAG: ribosomal RNA small subunit methyltransferase A [Planctomycetes bacterium]|jgi:16S rRNA (adenine1518-N6/adenine1519-N6)-dimethyltransferase|nr:ribosomal RNA small subunit methyltransferase A [Planctomycetota bacterium]MBT6453484.1 ribosomal RNA small subunit methyltransferase A [Planctomycetota bacterium]MBT6541195.1 ribosomal RNA small subunit methyltransferase A [Planctomycetota bacterium]MBT6785717.1 ribosomal RNA small subunit methyltransferase A [Planctomycetota bacterium]MBT6969101.1 ribosomal RNA small subunit methyltransferase A [Planctomycetota bacterium]